MPIKERLEAAQEWVDKKAKLIAKNKGLHTHLDGRADFLALLEYVVELEERLEKEREG